MHICVVLCSCLPLGPCWTLPRRPSVWNQGPLTFTKTYEAGKHKGIYFVKLPQRSSVVCPRSDSKTGAILGREPRKAWELVSIAPVLSQGTGLRAECHRNIYIAAHAYVGSETMGMLMPAFSSLREYIRSFLGVRHHPWSGKKIPEGTSSSGHWAELIQPECKITERTASILAYKTHTK